MTWPCQTLARPKPERRCAHALCHFCVFKDLGWTPDGKVLKFYLNAEMCAFNCFYHPRAVQLYVGKGEDFGTHRNDFSVICSVNWLDSVFLDIFLCSSSHRLNPRHTQTAAVLWLLGKYKLCLNALTKEKGTIAKHTSRYHLSIYAV